MKDHFPEYYRPTPAEFRALWKACIFGLDGTVLLNLYGYSETTREQLLSLLERLHSRIRMPHQFCLEYQRNRAHAIMEQVKNYAKVEKELRDIYDEEFKPKTKHPFLSARSLKLFDAIRDELTKGRMEHEALSSNDPYFTRATRLVGRISAKPTEQQLQTLHERARDRYSRKIPPGYADLKDKGEPGAYGDYIGWMQLIDIAKEENKPMILLTDDAKEDWWQIQSERTIGPRAELIAEFRAECGAPFYMYSSDQFMRLAKKYLKEGVEQAAIDEVSARLSRQMHQAATSKPEAKSTGDVSPAKAFMPPERELSTDAKATEKPEPVVQKSTGI